MEIKIHNVTSKVSAEEREVVINLAPDENGEWIANLYTCVEKYANRCKKKGWTQLSETRHTDGTFVGAEFTAPAKTISIREAHPAKRVISEEQRQAASERFRKIREEKERDNIENNKTTIV